MSRRDVAVPARVERAERPHFALIVDESPSMGDGNRAAAANAGLAQLLAAQQAVQSPQATLAVMMFNEDIRMVYRPGLLSEAREILVRPCGSLTGIRAAVVASITSTIRWVGKQPKDKRPDEVVIVMVTDGEETDDFSWDWEDVRHFVDYVREVLKWKFAFVTVSKAGARQATTQMGLRDDEVTLLPGSDEGVTEAFGRASDSMTTYTIK